MATLVGDILLDGKPYILRQEGYSRTESFRTRPSPAAQPRSLSTFEHQDNFTYFGQSKFLSQGFPNWISEGPFDIGFGLDIDPEGTISVADRMPTPAEEPDTANPDGWVAFRIGFPHPPVLPDDVVVFIGRTDGKSHVKNTVTGVWSSATSLPGGAKPVSHAFYSRVTLIGASDGKLFRTDNGVAFIDLGSPFVQPFPPLAANILGNLKGELYVGYADGSIWIMHEDLLWDPEPFVDPDILDMTPIIGASGTNVLYIITEGPSPRILFLDGKELFQANVIASDFAPRAAVFFGKLFIFGDQGFDVFTRGACWTLSANGLSEELSLGDGTVNQGIATAQVEGEVILFAASGNADVGASGIGVWDPRLDQSPDVSLGYYVANSTPFVSGQKINGIAAAKGKRYMGVTGVGIFGTTTPGTFKVRAGLFGADQRNIQKRWAQAEVHHSPLLAGQSVTVKARVDRQSADVTWGTSSTLGNRDNVIDAPLPPTFPRTPYLQAIISGDANGFDLTLYDFALAYIRVPDLANTRKEWIVKIAVEGWDNPKLPDPTRGRQFMRDGSVNTRTAVEMKAELDLLWNGEFVFQDIDGNSFKVLVKSPNDRPEAGSPGSGEIDRVVNSSGVVKNLSLDYSLHLIEIKPV